MRRRIVTAILLAGPGTGAAMAQSVGYEEDIKPALDLSCMSCHNSQAPTLNSYLEVKAKASQIVASLQPGASKPMPKGAAKLDDTTIKLFRDWQTAGAPEKRSTTAGTTKPSGTSTTAGGTKPPTGAGGTKPPGSTNGNPTPLVVDIAGRSELRFLDHPVAFDVYGTGTPVNVSWPTSDWGFLALDLNGNGVIDSGAELFGDATALRGGTTLAEHGFAALAQYDDNHDGRIDERDAVFSRLRVWVDRNGDGICQPDELQPLAAYHIKALRLDWHAAALKASPETGENLVLLGAFETTGETPEVRTLADVYLKTQSK